VAGLNGGAEESLAPVGAPALIRVCRSGILKPALLNEAW
jgi:hypothetical protein